MAICLSRWLPLPRHDIRHTLSLHMICGSDVIVVGFQELQSWGVKTPAHRKKFLEGIKLIPLHEANAPTSQDNTDDHSPVLFAQSPPPSLARVNTIPIQRSITETLSASQQSSLTQQSSFKSYMTQSFEVVEITMKKNLSSSTTTSASSTSQSFH